MSRPELLFPLFAGLETLDGIGPKTAKAFAGLGVTWPKDLLFLLPHSGMDRSRKTSVRDVALPTTVTVEVEVGGHFPPRAKGRPYRVMVRDAGLEFQLVFFHARGDFLQGLLPTGQRRLVSGRVELFDGIAQMVHPDHVLRTDEAVNLPEYEPVYPLTAGLTQKLVTKVVAGALERSPVLPEWIDPGLKAREGWPDWRTAIGAVHAPVGATDIAFNHPARLRLAYDELFAHQLTLSMARASMRRGKGQSSRGTGVLQDNILRSLPYAPTAAQVRALAEIAADMTSPLRMNRLLQGDVGSGKTLVAFLALLIAVEAGGQGVMMAPTEILARQHSEGLQSLARAAGVRLELLTGRDRGADRQAKLEDLAAGRIDILVGTHAVIQKDIEFKDLRLAVIDEQHRFGVAQRMELGIKGGAADVLVMTATPIPRSLALASYGDMDVSVLDEKPAGRKPIRTALIAADRMDEVVARLQKAVAEGAQAYWVCPLVEDSEVLDYASSEARFAALRAALGDGVVGMVHGQLPVGEKDAAMAAFVAGRTKVLVATTVIEVGLNVPNATIMVIERAETFGLAQLHQLRGRVGRGSAESTCLLLYQAPLSESGERRLKVIRDTEDGFRISEEDLAMRGAGDLIGTAQSGLPQFRIADLERQAGLMAVAQSDARTLLTNDPDLVSPRGQAARLLLWLLNQDRAIKLLSVG
ncbi:MAG: ATP-dependent DNA helicase RecG [Paracoccaceae bacterium]